MSLFGKLMRDDPDIAKTYAEMLRRMQQQVATPAPVPAAPPAPKREPLLVAGPTVGFRFWRLKNGLLHAVGMDTPWHPGEPNVAECRGQVYAFNAFGQTVPSPPTHKAPEAACQCGIYGMRRIADVPGYKEIETLVAGSVALWGKVIEQKLGYRGQYGYPIALWPPPLRVTVPIGFPSIRSRQLTAWETVAARYGVPLLEGPP